MSIEQDLARLTEQEAALVFDTFDEGTAFDLGSQVIAAGRKEGVGICILVKLWDREMFYAATPGPTSANYLWSNRKANTVRLTHRSTYRQVLERGDQPRLFAAEWGVDPAEYVFAGGGVPIVVKGAGVIGAAASSGTNERHEHEAIVAAMCSVIGLDYAALKLA